MQNKLIERYLKVKALALAGEGGERVAAQKILDSLEAKNPGLRAAAEAHARREAAPPPGQPAHRATGNWENIFRYAQWAWQEASHIAQQVTEAQYGTELADEVKFAARTRNRVLFVTMKLPYDLVNDVQSLNAVQKETFRAAVHDAFDRYLDAILKD